MPAACIGSPLDQARGAGDYVTALATMGCEFKQRVSRMEEEGLGRSLPVHAPQGKPVELATGRVL